MKVWIYMLAALMPLASYGQDVKTALKQVNQAYNTSGDYSAQMHYLWYANHSSTKPTEELQGEVRKQGKRLYQHYAEMEMMVNETYTVMVSHSDKLVMLQKASAAAYQPGVHCLLYTSPSPRDS